MVITEQLKTDIYVQYKKKVIGYLYNHTNNRELAEDLTSDVFLKVYSKLESFDDTKASLSTWIFTITRNTLTDHFRTRRVHDEIPETLAEDSSVEEDVCNSEMLNLLAGALEKLEERERDIIVLHYYSGKTLKEIGEKLGISYAYVKILHNRALDSIKEIMAVED